MIDVLCCDYYQSIVEVKSMATDVDQILFPLPRPSGKSMRPQSWKDLVGLDGGESRNHEATPLDRCQRRENWFTYSQPIDPPIQSSGQESVGSQSECLVPPPPSQPAPVSSPSEPQLPHQYWRSQSRLVKRLVQPIRFHFRTDQAMGGTKSA
jgi:hypothetical protein